MALGDYSGPDGARTVLRHPNVQLRGVGNRTRRHSAPRLWRCERADVAVVTNIQADHFGEYGIESADDLAETKLVVARAVCRGGTLVLNADDATLMAAATRLPHAAAARPALFALECAIRRWSPGARAAAAPAPFATVELVLHHAGQEWLLGDVAALPLTLDGAASYNVANLAAAALAAAALGLPPASIADTVRSFGARPQDNPGRLERFRLRGAQVLIDFAHNPDALEPIAAHGARPAAAAAVSAAGTSGKPRRRCHRRAGAHRRRFRARLHRDQGAAVGASRAPAWARCRS